MGALPGNPADALPIRLGANPAIANSERKKTVLVRSGLAMDEVHELTRGEPLPRRLLALLRVMLLTEKALVKKARAVGIILKGKDGQDSVHAGLLDALCQPLATALELEVLDALKGQLLRKRQVLEGVALNAESSSLNERHHAHYRQGQIDVAVHAIRAVAKAKKAWCKAHGVEFTDDQEEEEEEMDEEGADGDDKPAGSEPPAKRPCKR